MGIESIFKTYYNAAKASWLLKNPGKPVTTSDLAEHVGIAITSAMTPTNVINSFEKTGIHPFDRAILTTEDLLASTKADLSSPNIIQNPLDLSLQDIRENEHNSLSVLENETPRGPLMESPTFQQGLSLVTSQGHSDHLSVIHNQNLWTTGCRLEITNKAPVP